MSFVYWPIAVLVPFVRSLSLPFFACCFLLVCLFFPFFPFLFLPFLFPLCLWLLSSLLPLVAVVLSMVCRSFFMSPFLGSSFVSFFASFFFGEDLPLFLCSFVFLSLFLSSWLSVFVLRGFLSFFANIALCLCHSGSIFIYKQIKQYRNMLQLERCSRCACNSCYAA